jgi:hypothetical protein
MAATARRSFAPRMWASSGGGQRFGRVGRLPADQIVADAAGRPWRADGQNTVDGVDAHVERCWRLEMLVCCHERAVAKPESSTLIAISWRMPR